jgi:hypothetical protein
MKNLTARIRLTPAFLEQLHLVMVRGVIPGKSDPLTTCVLEADLTDDCEVHTCQVLTETRVVRLARFARPDGEPEWQEVR